MSAYPRPHESRKHLTILKDTGKQAALHCKACDTVFHVKQGQYKSVMHSNPHPFCTACPACNSAFKKLQSDDHSDPETLYCPSCEKDVPRQLWTSEVNLTRLSDIPDQLVLRRLNKRPRICQTCVDSARSGDCELTEAQVQSLQMQGKMATAREAKPEKDYVPRDGWKEDDLPVKVNGIWLMDNTPPSGCPEEWDGRERMNPCYRAMCHCCGYGGVVDADDDELHSGEWKVFLRDLYKAPPEAYGCPKCQAHGVKRWPLNTEEPPLHQFEDVRGSELLGLHREFFKQCLHYASRGKVWIWPDWYKHPLGTVEEEAAKAAEWKARLAAEWAGRQYTASDTHVTSHVIEEEQWEPDTDVIVDFDHNFMRCKECKMVYKSKSARQEEYLKCHACRRVEKLVKRPPQCKSMHAWCPVCDEEKPVSDFMKHSTTNPWKQPRDLANFRKLVKFNPIGDIDKKGYVPNSRMAVCRSCKKAGIKEQDQIAEAINHRLKNGLNHSRHCDDRAGESQEAVQTQSSLA